MKTILFLFLFAKTIDLVGQDCYCVSNPHLKELISCDTSIFKNKAYLFWSYNCDSSWLTFVSPKNEKKILCSLDSNLKNFTGKLGYTYWFEFKYTFIV